MATNLKAQEELFLVIGRKLKEKIIAYAIGGNAMLYHNAKTATKDIDIVFENKRERDIVLGVLKELGFTKRSTRILYFEKRNVPILLQRGEDRFDLFYDKVIDFKFTETIKERVTGAYEYENFIIKVISPEDIILLKCATERAGDRIDAAEIIKRTNVDWNVIMDEAVNQMRIIGDVIPISLFDFMSELKEDLKVEISDDILKKLGEYQFI